MIETLVPYSVRLRKDQVDFLRALPNVADFIRTALDAAIRSYEVKPEESPDLARWRRIVHLQSEIEQKRKEHAEIKRRWTFLAAKKRQIETFESFYKPFAANLDDLRVDVLRPSEWHEIYRVHPPDNPDHYIEVKAVLDRERALNEAHRRVKWQIWLYNQNKIYKEEIDLVEKMLSQYEAEIGKLEEQIPK